MKSALEQSKKSVDYINTHGTSTPTGDVAELKYTGSFWRKNSNNKFN